MLQPSTLRLPSSSPGDFRRPGGASLRSACPHDTSLCERSRYLFSLACVVYPASQHIFNSVCSPLSCVHCGLFFFFFLLGFIFPLCFFLGLYTCWSFVSFCYFAVSCYFVVSPLSFSVSAFISCFMELLAFIEGSSFEVLLLMVDCLGAANYSFFLIN